ncbi:MAG: glycosyltransferase [Deltaproteobacteria bacterium]|nr:glycosyltransferase [Deltaproteobacteria bacterium]
MESVRIGLVHDSVLPTPHYGGTERVVWWLAKGLCELGVELTLFSRTGSQFPFGKHFATDFRRLSALRSESVDLLHYFAPPNFVPQTPYLVTIGGNGVAGERYLPNSVFVSGDHARRHHAEAFVYNGIDPDDYRYSDFHDGSLLFLAKASWRVKNVKGAIRIARQSRRRLHILGGSRLWKSWRGVTWEGVVGGTKKRELLARSQALLFPVIWDEPFGLAVVEAMMSGVPVLSTRRGSLPELVSSDVGFLCDTYGEFIEAVERSADINRARCREWALENFHYRKMAKRYLHYYERVLEGQSLNPMIPFTDGPQGEWRELAPLNT